MLKKIRQKYREAKEWLFPWQCGLFVVQRCEDEPDSVAPGIVYIVGEKGHEWTASFVCPCGCSQTVRLNLIGHKNRDTWQVFGNRRGTATIVPSVWRYVGCRSHFVMRKGKIHWCKP